ncbi:UDP-D-galactose:(glucosyl)lipopolysaccharide-1,6-D-galactosyltransferase [Shewanella baltica]|uniref:glycosyltransferase n=1 Tax=Shewanella baltica TaxID=62322 RepID=UPI000F6C4012|nr:glycosyltransferase [Shewanella baltica]VEF25374.1 UDP-D-galactose:(glucosyl)lipopolysaccharide-1,6-D-galactosyltransferase [Shewanella baltica]
MSKLNILHILPTLSQGGAEKFTLDLCNEYHKDHCVNLMILYSGGHFDALEPAIDGPNLHKLHLGGWKKIIIPFYILGYLIKNRMNVVHLHLMTPFFCILSIIFFRHIKFVYTFHGDPSYDNRLVRVSIQLLTLFNNVTFVAVSPSIRKLVLGMYKGIDVKVVINGASTPSVNERNVALLRNVYSNKKLFLNVARLDNIKNQLELVLAFRDLPDEYHLLIIGGDPSTDYSRTLIFEINKTNNVEYLGFKSCVGDYIKIADYIIFSSLHEGLPISLIESFSLSTPVLCTPIPGLNELISDKKVGLCFEGFLKEDFVKLLSGITANNNMSKSLSKNAEDLYRADFEISIVAAKYLELYFD